MQPLNTTPEVMVEQAARNLERDLPVFVEQEAHNGKVCIVGGGPSLKDTLPYLRFLQGRGAVVLTLNGTHDWLIDRGVPPHFHVMLDARLENADFVRKPRAGTGYLIAAQCHPEVFDALSGHEVITWVADVPGMREVADEVEKPVTLIGGGSTVGLKSMALMYLWGFRSFALFGMDSCYREAEHHAYHQPLNDLETRLETTFNGKRFNCSPWMLAQAEDFAHDAEQLIQKGCSIKAYGEGLIQTVLTDINQRRLHAAN